MNTLRISRIQNLMADYHVDYLLVCHPKHVYYLTGFSTNARPYWQISQTCCLLPKDKDPILFLPHPWGEEINLNFSVEIAEYTGSLTGCVRQLASRFPKETNVRVAADLTWMGTLFYQELNREIPWIQLMNEHPILAKSKMIKDKDELAFLYHAIRISDSALLKAGELIREGRTEWDIKEMLDSLLFAEGSYGSGFTTKVISGSNGSLPHHTSGSTRIQNRSATIVDLSASTECYESDSARTYLAGERPEELSRIHREICEILNTLPRILLPGTPLVEIDTYVRRELTRIHPVAIQAGNIGHGVGLHAHEYPDICPSCQEVLQDDMVLAIEPALYLPGCWGIRIENMFHIHSTGSKSMNTLEVSYGNL